MSVKLQKKIKNENLYYIVCNPETKKYKDWFLFEESQELPILENYVFKIMANEILSQFKEKEYSSTKYKTILLILYNICFDGDKINLRTSSLISNLYINIRYKDLANEIEMFRNKYEINSIEKYKNTLLQKNLNVLSPETKKLFELFKNKIGKDKSDSEIFKELIYLSIFIEYEKAKSKAKKMSNLIEEIHNFKLIEDN